jgi:hypothetical protein
METDEQDDDQESRYYWSEWFLSLKGSEFFCEVDEDFILDRFNLTGLNTEVPQYALAYDLITDSIENDIEDETIRLQVEKSSRHLYGLIHARYIVRTTPFPLIARTADEPRPGENAGKVQDGGFRHVSACLLPQPARPPRRHLRQCRAHVGEAVLPAVRGCVRARLQTPPVDRRRVLWHNIPAFHGPGLYGSDCGGRRAWRAVCTENIWVQDTCVGFGADEAGGGQGGMCTCGI